ncbi:septal ring lytic transglycosylase RlpA family protein [Thiohalocapsa sp. ML1]|jgi:rare lipoprotein A|uniref:septal ring lytic transglycosylase RlpA family protein n=1 Tax=Thiohalocapsa sp. ML1 TaxID=1431688 RepID=UPI0009EC64BE
MSAARLSTAADWATRQRTAMGCAALLLALSSMLSPAPALAAGEGMASYYGAGFHGRRTASGQRFDQHAMTAAHRTLGFGTRVRVTDKRTGRSVVVTINDRGPFKRGRIIDLSRGAAQRLGIVAAGVAPVRVEVLGREPLAGRIMHTGASREASLLRELF